MKNQFMLPLQVTQKSGEINFSFDHAGRNPDETRKWLKPLKKLYSTWGLKFWIKEGWDRQNNTYYYPECRIHAYVYSTEFPLAEFENDLMTILEKQGITKFRRSYYVWSEVSL